METSFNSRLSLANSPPYQSTPMIRKPQMSHYSSGIPLSYQSTVTPEFKTPTLSIHMNGDDGANSDDAISTKYNHNNKSPSPAFKLAEMDSTTIMRQRKELQLMIAELKERDKELNELVQSHHKQLVSWEVDRERMAGIVKQFDKVKTEYRKRHEQCKLLKDKLRKYENEIRTKNKEIVTLQTQLQQIEDRGTSFADQIEELEQKNRTLQSSIEELSTNVGNLRAHEQQLETLLRLRDNDLKDANLRVSELTDKLKTINTTISEYRKTESETKAEFIKCRSENATLKDEMEKLKSTQHETVEVKGQEEVSQLKQEIIVLQKELLLSSDREKRKDSFLDLARSKQERTELELCNLRLLYNTLQSDAVMIKQQRWEHDDDKVSVFSMSEFGEKEATSQVAILNSTSLLDSPAPSFLASTEGHEMQKFSPISKCASSANVSVVTVHNEDTGTMSTGELRQTDLSSNEEIIQTDGINFDSNITPASRLEKLLTQSQQMVEDLEKSSTYVAMKIIVNGKEESTIFQNNEQDKKHFLVKNGIQILEEKISPYIEKSCGIAVG